MSFADGHLAEDESLVHATRRHWTEPVGEFVILCLVWLVAGALLGAWRLRLQVTSERRPGLACTR